MAMRNFHIPYENAKRATNCRTESKAEETNFASCAKSRKPCELKKVNFATLQNLASLVKSSYNLGISKEIPETLVYSLRLLIPQICLLPYPLGEETQRAAKEAPPKLILKPLPTELKYTYLEEDKQCPVVISSALTIH
ncbi:hypothetical protein CK203_049348 [Vitis vinifera]|uniref:Uncharacterized protein n=1 Tax=Vitis vinifera TaxID=29760 RepID=A0A438FVQ5_VITVI|nr:hypothetical protein CK203_049348 [Vitis vinifera]